MLLIERFLEMMLVERNATKNTISSYKTDLLLLSEFLKPKEIKDAIFDDLNNYLFFLYEKKYSTETISRKIITFRQFYKFLYSENIIKSNPTLSIELQKKSFKIPKYLTKDEINKLFEIIENDKSLTMIHTMLEILYVSGMRISELITIKISDIISLLNNQNNSQNNSQNHDQNYYQNYDQNYIIISGKGNKERVIPFTDKTIAVLRRYVEIHRTHREIHRETHKETHKELQDSIWLFPGKVVKGKDRHITRQRFGQILKEIAIKANIPPDRVSPHVIRHSFATHLLDNGLDIKTLQDLLGHSSISTTQIYTHIPNHKLQKSILKSHPLNKELERLRKI